MVKKWICSRQERTVVDNVGITVAQKSSFPEGDLSIKTGYLRRKPVLEDSYYGYGLLHDRDQ